MVFFAFTLQYTTIYVDDSPSALVVVMYVVDFVVHGAGVVVVEVVVVDGVVDVVVVSTVVVASAVVSATVVVMGVVVVGAIIALRWKQI